MRKCENGHFRLRRRKHKRVNYSLGKYTAFFAYFKGFWAKILHIFRILRKFAPVFSSSLKLMNRILSTICFAFLSLAAFAGIDPASDDARFNGDRCYGFGNFETAVKYYQRAVDIDAKNVRALTRLGSMYKRGLGVKRNYKTALDWYMKAAATGDGNAVFNVGTFFLSGLGVKANTQEAMRWFELASEKGCADADYQLGCLYFAGTNGVPQDYTQALYWYQKAAERRYLAALTNIGYMCCNGLGVVKDSAIGVQWYLYAAKYGSAEAMRNLGYCYMAGDGVDADEAAGIDWYQKAAALGDKPSIAYLRSIGEYTAPEDQYEEVPLVISEDDVDEEAGIGATNEENDEFGEMHNLEEEVGEGTPATFDDLPSVPQNSK